MWQNRGLRPQDVLILLKVIAAENRSWQQQELASEIGISRAEFSHGLERLRASALLDDGKKSAMRLAALELLLHGLKYFYPPRFGSWARGVPTAHAHQPLSGKIVRSETDTVVWPAEFGNLRGISLEPLYETVPEAATKDPELHVLLALVDAVRIGRGRLAKIAETELTKRILGDRGRKREPSSS